ncbi:DUF5709 domain-containing protein [Kitasatospora sp. NPDC048540]|uniref:DUF5709 domain-containing protein n=1 Tax=unclassified Kitasatospora TaxID=2633591 RepID=UPI00053B4BFA|nr:DUF5709 domain-containing protein [Kitasatospora sp. MBT63]
MAGTENARGDDVYQPEAGDVVDDAGVLDTEDTLSQREADPYDEGWTPPERPLAVERRGTTVEEQRRGETLDQRLAQENPDDGPQSLDRDGDGIGDTSDTDGEPWDREVGVVRAGRLAATDAPGPNTFAADVGIDGAAASAEEAAVHVIPDDEDEPF